MRSVADTLRDESRRALIHLSVHERIALAFRLGDEDVERYCSLHGVDRATAKRFLARARSIGRQPSRANASDLP